MGYLQIERTPKYQYHYLYIIGSNHSIFRHDNFIGCFPANKIKMSARK